MKKISKIVFICFVYCGYASAQEDPGSFFIRNYSSKEYKAGIQNWAIAQDKRGILYVGNSDGILEYDGASWRKIRTGNRTTARSLAVDDNGRIYVGGKSEFGYLEPDSIGQLQFMPLHNKLPASHSSFADVLKTYATKDGVYFQTYHHLFFWSPHQSSFKVWKPQTQFQRSFLIRDKLYIVQTDIGLMELKNDSLQIVPDGQEFAKQRVYSMLPFGSDKILIATRSKGLFIYDGVKASPFLTPENDFLVESQLYCGAVLRNGDIALGTNRSGVIILDKTGNIKYILDKSRGLQNNNVSYITTDSQGAMWLALDNGITRAETASPVSFYTEDSGFKGTVLSIIRHQGVLYVTTALGVYYLDLPKKPERPAYFKPVTGIATQSWSFLSWGPSLLAATSEGVYSINGNKATLIQKRSVSLSLAASKYVPGRIYTALQNGLSSFRWENGTWVDEGKVKGVHEDIRTIVERDDGVLWLGTRYQGLLRITPSVQQSEEWVVERFGTEHGLPKGGIRAFSINGRETFGTDKGLMRFDQARGLFVFDSTFGNIFTDTLKSVSLLSEDIKKNIWIYTEDEEKPKLFILYHQTDGSYQADRTPFLRFSEFAILTIYHENTGVVWFGGPDGLIRYDSRMSMNYNVDFQAFIRRVSINKDSVIYGGAFAGSVISAGPKGNGSLPDKRELSYSDNTIRFECAASSYDNESENRFQYFLEGADRSWSAWTKETKRDYTHLPEGNYRFHVRAKNIYEHPGSEAAIDFNILPPWQRTWWAYLFYVMCATGCLYGFVKWRAQSLEKEKERLERIVEDRTIEVVKQKEKLEQRTTELETINVVVSSINSEVSFTDLLKSILNETSVIHGVEKASALVFDRNKNVFCFKAAKGWEMKDLEPIELSLQESEERYVENSLEIFEDVYVIKDVKGRRGEEKMVHIGIPKSMLITRIRIDGRVEGYFIYDNMHYDNAFEDQDILLLKNLKEHITSAFIKSRMLEDLQLKNSQIMRASELKSKFMADMSHELRTPMNAILGFSDLLKQKLLGEINPGQEDALQAISESGKNLLQLINDILDLSKIEAGKMALHPKTVYLEEVVLSVRNVIISLIQKKKQQFSITIDPSINLYVDETKLKQVLFNLLANANKFTPEGGKIGIEAKVIAGTAEQAEEIDIRVSDTGKGIPPSDLLSVFEEFRQVEGDSEQGTGLGLTLCKKFIELHHGRIFAESDGTNGSVFIIKIPSKPPGDPVSKKLACSPMQSPISILIIEDDPGAVKILKYYMEKEGYATMVAVNGKDGIRMAQKDKPSVVTLDVMLPDKNGWEVLKELKSRPETEHLPVIMISAVEENEQGLQLKANDYFVKPVDRKELIHAIDRLSGKENAFKSVKREEFLDEIKSVTM